MAKWNTFVWGDGTKWGHAAADYPHRVPLTIKIAGTDRTDSIDPATALIEEIATKQDSRASFIIKNGGSMSLAELDAVIIAGWEQEHEFAGYIWKLEELARGVQLDYRVDCTDYTWDLQHPEALVDEKYTSKSDQYIIQDFMATSCPGIEVTTYVEEVNSDTVSVSFDNDTPFAVIERLAEDAGAEWYVDFGPVAGDPTKWAYLHYFDSGTNAAPYSLSDTPDFSASFPYKNVSEFTEAPLANKVVVVGRDRTVTRTRGAEADYGRWLVAKLVNLDITTTAQANSVGDQFLTEVAATASYRLDAHEPGLRAGQNVTFVNAIRGVNDSFMIMSLSKRFERAGLAAYTVQLGKYIPSLAAIIVRDSDAGGATGTVVADAIKADLGVFDELLLYLSEGDPTLGFNIDGVDLFTLGIDDSDYDKWKIALGDVLGIDDVFTIDSLGDISICKDVGDPILTFEIADVDEFTLGVDDSDSDKFKLDDGSSLADYSLFELASDCVLSLTADGADPRAELRLKTYSATITNASLLGFQKSHDDTAGTKTETINNDRLGTIAFYGVDTGSNFDLGASIHVLQAGNAGTMVPTEMIFTTYDDSGNPNKFTIDENCVAKLIAGSAAPQAVLQLETYNATITNLSTLRFQKSHNDTVGTKTETVTNDRLGAINFFGIDTGSNADLGAQILGIQNGIAGTTVPTDLEFHCYDHLGVDHEYRMSRYGWFYIEVPSGDPLVIYSIDESAKFATGVDDDDSDKFKISVGGSLGTNDALWIDSSGNVGGITGQPMFGVVGTLAVADDQAPWFICGHANGLTLVSTASVAKTAPTGAAITFDIELSSDGASWATIYSVLPSIADGSRVGTDGTLSTTTMDQGDMLRLNIDQAGSTVAGADLTASLRVESR